VCVHITGFLAKRDYVIRWANGMTNPSICHLSVVCDVRVPYSWDNFASFCHPATHPPKITNIVQGITSSEQISLTGVWLCDSSKQEGGGQTGESGKSPPIIKSRLAISSPDEFLVIIPRDASHASTLYATTILTVTRQLG